MLHSREKGIQSARLIPFWKCLFLLFVFFILNSVSHPISFFLTWGRVLYIFGYLCLYQISRSFLCCWNFSSLLCIWLSVCAFLIWWKRKKFSIPTHVHRLYTQFSILNTIADIKLKCFLQRWLLMKNHSISSLNVKNNYFKIHIGID